MFLQDFVGLQSSSRSALRLALRGPDRAQHLDAPRRAAESSTTIPPVGTRAPRTSGRGPARRSLGARRHPSRCRHASARPTPACTASASARIETAISAGVSGADVEPGRPVDPAQVGDAAVGQPVGPGLLHPPRAERADVADVAGQRRRQGRAGELVVVAGHHHLVRARPAPAMTPVAVAGVGDDLGLPAEQRGGRGPARRAIAPAPTITSCGHRPQHRDDGVRRSATASLTPRANSCADLLAGVGDRLGGRTARCPATCVAVEPGDQADRLAAAQQLPQLGRQVGGRDQQAARVARRRAARPPARRRR